MPRRHLYVTETLLNKFKQKRESFKKFKKYPTRENYNIYCNARNDVKQSVRAAKKDKEVHIAKLSKTNPKAFYNYISSNSKPKDKVSNLIKEDGSVTENAYEKAETLNEFFSSVFTREKLDNLPDCNKKN